ncbi:F-box/FBD/LRR-repeat protein-like protein [Tanacetum coccineum]
MLEHLNELEIYDFVYNKIRLDFVKFILARARVLKKVRLSLDYDCRDERFRIIKVGVGSVYISPPPYPASAGLGMLLLFDNLMCTYESDWIVADFPFLFTRHTTAYISRNCHPDQHLTHNGSEMQNQREHDTRPIRASI